MTEYPGGEFGAAPPQEYDDAYYDDQAAEALSGLTDPANLIDPGQAAELERAQQWLDERDRRHEAESSESGVDLTFGLTDEELDQAAAEIEERHPELQDPVAAEQLIELAEEAALAETRNQTLAAALARNPAWVERFYVSFKAQGGRLERSAGGVGDGIVAAAERGRGSFFTG